MRLLTALAVHPLQDLSSQKIKPPGNAKVFRYHVHPINPQHRITYVRHEVAKTTKSKKMKIEQHLPGISFQKNTFSAFF